MSGRREVTPWGERNPQGGYRVGDEVGVIFSDHEHYIFDNPTGVVTAVDDQTATISVMVGAMVNQDRLYLIERPEKKSKFRPLTEDDLKNTPEAEAMLADLEKAFAELDEREITKLRRDNASLILKLNDVVGMYDSAMERLAAAYQEVTVLTNRITELEAK